MDIEEVRTTLGPYIESNLSRLSIKTDKKLLHVFMGHKYKFKAVMDRLNASTDNLVARATITKTNKRLKELILTLGEKGSPDFYPLAVLKDFNDNITESLLQILAKLQNTNEATLTRLRQQARERAK